MDTLHPHPPCLLVSQLETQPPTQLISNIGDHVPCPTKEARKLPTHLGELQVGIGGAATYRPIHKPNPLLQRQVRGTESGPISLWIFHMPPGRGFDTVPPSQRRFSATCATSSSEAKKNARRLFRHSFELSLSLSLSLSSPPLDVSPPRLTS